MTAPEPDDTPPADYQRTLAHISDNVLSNQAHAVRHAVAARNAADRASRGFNLLHLEHHVRAAQGHQRTTISILRAWSPEIRAELDKLTAAADPDPARSLPVPEPEAVPEPQRPATLGHLASTVLVNQGHVLVHAVSALQAPDQKSRMFALDHCDSHLAGAVEHERKFISALCAWFPEIRDELGKLTDLTSPASRSPVDAGRSVGGVMVEPRCDGCGALEIPGVPCLECGRSADAYERAAGELRERFAANSVNGVL